MKTSISKKSKVLIAVISIAVLIALTTVAVLANDTVDYGEKFNGVYLSSAGDVKLVFCYDKATTDAAGIDAFVVKYSDGREDVVYNVADLNETANGYEVSAAFAPAELNVVASVYASKKDVEATVCDSYSVVNYANKVLASEGLAEYHNVTKAILNYGAMAQVYFNKDTSTLANAGLYDLGTNPAYGVGSDSVANAVANVTNGEAITVKGAQMFCQTKTTLRVYFTYEGENALTATVSGAGLDNATAAILSDADGYYVDVTNISAKLYDDVFTFTVTDGADVCTVEVNVLGAIKSQAKTTYSPIQNVVASMYLFYANVDGTVAANCAHGCGEYTVVEGNLAYSVCSVCDAKLSEGVSTEYKSLSTDNFNMVNEGYMIDAEGGFMFQRFHNDQGNGNNSPMTFVTTDDEPIALGRYFVMKWRINTEWTSSGWMTLNFDGKMSGDPSACGSHATREANCMCNVKAAVSAADANNWRVWVIDLEWDGVAVNETTSQLYFNHSPFQYGAQVDIAYAAICQDWIDVAEYVQEETVQLMNNNPNWKGHMTRTSAAYNWAGDLEHSKKIQTEKVIDNGDGTTTYQHVNAFGRVLAEKTVLNALPTYLSPSNQVVAAGVSVDQGLKYEKDANGNEFVYHSYKINSWGGTNGSVLKFVAADNYVDAGRYLVVKWRETPPEGLTSWIGDSGTTVSTWGTFRYTIEGQEQTSIDGIKTLLNTTLNGTWRTVVFDLGADAQGKRISNVYIHSNQHKHSSVVDVAYAAFCENWAQVDAVVDESTVTKFNGSTTQNYDFSADAEAARNAVYEKVVVGTNGDKTYNYVKYDGTIVTSKTVPASIATFVSPATAKPFASSLKSAGVMTETDANGNVFAFERYNVVSNAAWGLVFADANHVLDGGRYFVLKIRMPADFSATWGGLNYSIDGGDNNKFGGGHNAFYDNKGAWAVVYFDLAEMVSAEGKQVTALSFGWNDCKSGNIDVAYAAFCNSWAEIDAIVDEATITKAKFNNGNSWTYGAETKNIMAQVNAENPITETVTTNPDGSKTYTYARATGEVYGSTTVPAGINSYVSPGMIVGSDIGYVDGVAYKAAKEETNMIPASPAEAITGRYVIIKLKAESASGTWGTFSVNDSGSFSHSGGFSDTTWRYVVLDLETESNNKFTKIGSNTPITKAVINIANSINMHVAYIATCDTWAEIQSLTGNVSVRVLSNPINPATGDSTGNATDVWGNTNVADCVAAEAAGTLK